SNCCAHCPARPRRRISRMSGSVALITGAASGIGRALAFRLARRGGAIAALDCQDEGLRTLAGELAGIEQPFAWAVADVTQPDSLRTTVRDLEAKIGPTDLLIATAGVGIETYAADLRPADV